MARPNLYDTPAEYKPINSYVSPPFEEIALALGSRQKQVDDNINDIYNRANSLNIATIAEHEPARETFVNEYNTRFLNLLNSGIEPGSQEFLRNKKLILDDLARDSRPGIFKRS